MCVNIVLLFLSFLPVWKGRRMLKLGDRLRSQYPNDDHLMAINSLSECTSLPSPHSHSSFAFLVVTPQVTLLKIHTWDVSSWLLEVSLELSLHNGTAVSENTRSYMGWEVLDSQQELQQRLCNSPPAYVWPLYQLWVDVVMFRQGSTSRNISWAFVCLSPRD